MIVFDVTLEALPEHREQFVSLLNRSMAGSQQEAGCLIYRFTADLNNPLRFYLLELWQDEATLIGHAQGEPFKRFIAEIAACGRVISSVARSGALEPYTFKRPQ